MLVVGITGGTCTGKSYICRHLVHHFESRGLCTEWLDCDVIAHRLYATDADTQRAIATAFGPKVLDATGAVNRAALGALVFADRDQLERLNAIAWPAMRKRVEEAIRETTSNIFLIDAAVLEAAGWSELCDAVLRVEVDFEIAGERARARGLDQARFTQVWELQQATEKKLGAEVVSSWEDAASFIDKRISGTIDFPRPEGRAKNDRHG